MSLNNMAMLKITMRRIYQLRKINPHMSPLLLPRITDTPILVLAIRNLTLPKIKSTKKKLKP